MGSGGSAALRGDELSAIHQTAPQDAVAPFQVDAVGDEAGPEPAGKHRSQVTAEKVRVQRQHRGRLAFLRQRHDGLRVSVGGELLQRRILEHDDPVGVADDLADELVGLDGVGGANHGNRRRLQPASGGNQLQAIGIDAPGPVFDDAPHLATHSTFSFSRNNVTSSATTVSAAPSSIRARWRGGG